MFVLLFITSLAWADDNTPKYREAGRVAAEAALKQSSIEEDFLKIKSAAEGKGRKYLREKGLEPVAAFVGFTYTTVIKRKLRGKSGNLILEVEEDKSELTWGFQF